MMMKRFASLVMGILLTLTATETCFATIRPEECAIGGISLSSKPDQIRAIYGAPTQETTKQFTGYRNIVTNLYMVYGNSFKLLLTDYHGDGDYFMHSIETTANNGLGTPSGLMVGDPVEKAFTLYGMPDATCSDEHDYRNHATQQDLKDIEKGRRWAIYNKRYGGCLIIKAKKGKITSLKVESTAE